MIDAHHHIWRQSDLPWLRGPEQPRIFGEYSSIRRDYLIDEYLADIEGSEVSKSVYVQANWHPDEAVQEARWVQEIADEHKYPHAIVAFADFTVQDVRPQLEALSDIPLVRGIRQQFHWHENPSYRFAANAGVVASDAVKTNIKHLADYGWSFDLQVFAGQMHDAATLVSDCPDVTFVLQHAGMLEDLSDEGKRQWREGMRTLAERPNVVTKLSAFGTFIRRNDPTFISQMITEATKIFGADRCLFGSNFPIEKIWTDYESLIASFREAVERLDPGFSNAIFEKTAQRIYRI